MNTAQPATFLSAESSAFRYVEKSNPQTSNLQFLTYGVYELTGPIRSGALSHPGEEALLFCWQGEVTRLLERHSLHSEALRRALRSARRVPTSSPRTAAKAK